MKIAFVGKGGSGKTTLAALVARSLVARQFPVLAIDADINQHLAYALSGDHSIKLPPLGIKIDRIKEYVRGNNPRIMSAKEMIKTTPPGEGSRLMRLNEKNPVYDYFVKEVGGVRLMVAGEFTKEDLGVKCYHSKTGAVELFLNHLIDKPKEYIVVDMTAGADSFASGLFTRFDATFVVVEPTLKSVSVFEQYMNHAKDFSVSVFAVGNKIADDDDLRFLEQKVGKQLIATFGYSHYVRAMEKGEFLPLETLEPKNNKALIDIVATTDKSLKNWKKFYAQAVEFHKRNAESWGNEAVGKNLLTQVDPNFVFPES